MFISLTVLSLLAQIEQTKVEIKTRFNALDRKVQDHFAFGDVVIDDGIQVFNQERNENEYEEDNNSDYKEEWEAYTPT